MATRSAIGVKHGDIVKAVYCHWDGYPECNGRILIENYQDSVKINKLISLGDLSTLGAEIGEKHEFDNRNEYLTDGIATQCKFYGRDRGEADTEFTVFPSEELFLKDFDRGVEYYYLYDSGVWYVSEYGREFKPLHEVLEALDNKEAA